MKFDCAIFDLDGTLINSQEMWTRVKTEVLTSRGIPCSAEDELDLKSMELPATSQALSKEWPTGITPEEAMAEVLKSVYYHYSNVVELNKGAMELLKKLHAKGITCCLGTASNLEWIEPVITRLGIKEQMDHIVTCEMVGKDKHFPDCFLEVARRAGVDPSRAVVFEDAGYSLRAAKSVGFLTVGINEPASDGTAEELRPLCNWFVDDFTQLPEDFWQD
ncbi:MAG: HAD family phosphatase [Oscillospiraceae bacterium]|nr:HAD family phosphatase [Oscillospiraceae bacterium]